MERALQARRHSRKQERLEARITPEQKRLIKRAAELRGTTIAEFVVFSAQQTAAETIKDFEVLTLQNEARQAFVQAILNPAPPNQAARAAVKRYRQRTGP